MTDILVFWVGLCVGSFLNVCIYRTPRDQSVADGRSRCTECGHMIPWYDNIPLLSYIILRGKCRFCSKRFTFRYFFVELLTACVWLWLFRTYGAGSVFVQALVFFSILIAVTFTDFETGYIPDVLSIPGMIFGLIFSALFPSLLGASVWYQGLLRSFLGLLVGGGSILILGMIGDMLFKKESMGGGDIKLLAMIGAFLGMEKALLVFFVSPVFSMPVALYIKLAKKGETMPFGPYLALAGAWTFVGGDAFFKTFFYLPSY